MKKWLAVGVVMVCMFMAVPGFAGVPVDDDGNGKRRVSVSGTAETVLDAEYATIDIRIDNTKSEASESYNASAEDVKNLYASLKKIGIKEADIKKSLIEQGTNYDRIGGKAVKKGYYSRVYITITVKDVGAVGKVYGALAEHNSVTINRTMFRRNDTAEQKKELFKKALLAAKSKAEFMAKSLGAGIGEVVSIYEASGDDEYYGARGLSNSYSPESDGGDGNYGTVSISVCVSVVFELK